jgi:hypothetical protein
MVVKSKAKQRKKEKERKKERKEEDIFLQGTLFM